MVDVIEETLGHAMILLVGLALVLLTAILVLVEADCILRLGQKLVRRWKSGESERGGPHSPTAEDGHHRACHEEEVK